MCIRDSIVAAFKVVPDDQDIQVSADRTLDCSKAKGIVSAYDLNALEAAAQLGAASEDSRVVAVTAGPSSINDSKLKKNVLARGVDELFMAADDAYANMDAHAAAAALASLVEQVGAYDLILCGDGSADNYAQQTDVQPVSYTHLLHRPVHRRRLSHSHFAHRRVRSQEEPLH